MINLKEILPFLAPLFLIQLGLQAYSIISLVKRRRVRFDNKPLWGAIILIFGIFGSVAYLAFRGDEE